MIASNICLIPDSRPYSTLKDNANYPVLDKKSSQPGATSLRSYDGKVIGDPRDGKTAAQKRQAYATDPISSAVDSNNRGKPEEKSPDPKSSAIDSSRDGRGGESKTDSGAPIVSTDYPTSSAYDKKDRDAAVDPNQREHREDDRKVRKDDSIIPGAAGATKSAVTELPGKRQAYAKEPMLTAFESGEKSPEISHKPGDGKTAAERRQEFAASPKSPADKKDVKDRRSSRDDRLSPERRQDYSTAPKSAAPDTTDVEGSKIPGDGRLSPRTPHDYVTTPKTTAIDSTPDGREVESRRIPRDDRSSPERRQDHSTAPKSVAPDTTDVEGSKVPKGYKPSRERRQEYATAPKSPAIDSSIDGRDVEGTKLPRDDRLPPERRQDYETAPKSRKMDSTPDRRHSEGSKSPGDDRLSPERRQDYATASKSPVIDSTPGTRDLKDTKRPRDVRPSPERRQDSKMQVIDDVHEQRNGPRDPRHDRGLADRKLEERDKERSQSPKDSRSVSQKRQDYATAAKEMPIDSTYDKRDYPRDPKYDRRTGDIKPDERGGQGVQSPRVGGRTDAQKRPDATGTQPIDSISMNSKGSKQGKITTEKQPAYVTSTKKPALDYGDKDKERRRDPIDDIAPAGLPKISDECNHCILDAPLDIQPEYSPESDATDSRHKDDLKDSRDRKKDIAAYEGRVGGSSRDQRIGPSSKQDDQYQDDKPFDSSSRSRSAKTASVKRHDYASGSTQQHGIPRDTKDESILSPRDGRTAAERRQDYGKGQKSPPIESIYDRKDKEINREDKRDPRTADYIKDSSPRDETGRERITVPTVEKRQEYATRPQGIPIDSIYEQSGGKHPKDEKYDLAPSRRGEHTRRSLEIKPALEKRRDIAPDSTGQPSDSIYKQSLPKDLKPSSDDVEKGFREPRDSREKISSSREPRSRRRTKDVQDTPYKIGQLPNIQDREASDQQIISKSTKDEDKSSRGRASPTGNKDMRSVMPGKQIPKRLTEDTDSKIHTREKGPDISSAREPRLRKGRESISTERKDTSQTSGLARDVRRSAPQYERPLLLRQEALNESLPRKISTSKGKEDSYPQKKDKKDKPVVLDDVKGTTSIEPDPNHPSIDIFAKSAAKTQSLRKAEDDRLKLRGDDGVYNIKNDQIQTENSEDDFYDARDDSLPHSPSPDGSSKLSRRDPKDQDKYRVGSPKKRRGSSEDYYDAIGSPSRDSRRNLPGYKLSKEGTYTPLEKGTRAGVPAFRRDSPYLKESPHRGIISQGSNTGIDNDLDAVQDGPDGKPVSLISDTSHKHKTPLRLSVIPEDVSSTKSPPGLTMPSERTQVGAPAFRRESPYFKKPTPSDYTQPVDTIFDRKSGEYTKHDLRPSERDGEYSKAPKDDQAIVEKRHYYTTSPERKSIDSAYHTRDGLAIASSSSEGTCAPVEKEKSVRVSSEKTYGPDGLPLRAKYRRSELPSQSSAETTDDRPQLIRQYAFDDYPRQDSKKSDDEAYPRSRESSYKRAREDRFPSKDKDATALGTGAPASFEGKEIQIQSSGKIFTRLGKVCKHLKLYSRHINSIVDSGIRRRRTGAPEIKEIISNIFTHEQTTKRTSILRQIHVNKRNYQRYVAVKKLINKSMSIKNLDTTKIVSRNFHVFPVNIKSKDGGKDNEKPSRSTDPNVPSTSTSGLTTPQKPVIRSQKENTKEKPPDKIEDKIKDVTYVKLKEETVRTQEEIDKNVKTGSQNVQRSQPDSQKASTLSTNLENYTDSDSEDSVDFETPLEKMEQYFAIPKIISNDSKNGSKMKIKLKSILKIKTYADNDVEKYIPLQTKPHHKIETSVPLENVDERAIRRIKYNGAIDTTASTLTSKAIPVTNQNNSAANEGRTTRRKSTVFSNEYTIIESSLPDPQSEDPDRHRSSSNESAKNKISARRRSTICVDEKDKKDMEAIPLRIRKSSIKIISNSFSKVNFSSKVKLQTIADSDSNENLNTKNTVRKIFAMTKMDTKPKEHKNESHDQPSTSRNKKSSDDKDKSGNSQDKKNLYFLITNQQAPNLPIDLIMILKNIAKSKQHCTKKPRSIFTIKLSDQNIFTTENNFVSLETIYKNGLFQLTNKSSSDLNLSPKNNSETFLKNIPPLKNNSLHIRAEKESKIHDLIKNNRTSKKEFDPYKLQDILTSRKNNSKEDIDRRVRLSAVLSNGKNIFVLKKNEFNILEKKVFLICDLVTCNFI